jgi:hypothetical protein
MNSGGNNYNPRRPYNSSSFNSRDFGSGLTDGPDLRGLDDAQRQMVKEAAEAFARQLSSVNNIVQPVMSTVVPTVDLVSAAVPPRRTGFASVR